MSQAQSREQQLATAPVGKLMLKMAAPAVMAQFINVLYNVVDRIYIGHISGTGGLALTEAGERLLPSAEEILASLRQLRG